MMIGKCFRYLGPVIGAAAIYFFWPSKIDIMYRPFVALLPIIGGIIIPMCMKSCKNSTKC